MPLGNREDCIISVGQFRPEKDHQLQLDALACALEREPGRRDSLKLILLGSCRGPDDEARVNRLRQHATAVGINAQVEFAVNVSLAELQRNLGRASLGIHTMWNEHFGISVVEMMACCAAWYIRATTYLCAGSWSGTNCAQFGRSQARYRRSAPRPRHR